MSRSICTRICFAFPWDIKIWMLCVQNDSDCNKDWLRQWKWDPSTLWFYKDFEAFLYNSKIILKNAFANWVNCFYITPRAGSKSQQPEFVLEADLFLNTGIGNSVPYSDQKCMDYGASCVFFTKFCSKISEAINSLVLLFIFFHLVILRNWKKWKLKIECT